MEHLLAEPRFASQDYLSYAPALKPRWPHIRNENGFVQVDWLIGDLRPRQTYPPIPITIIPLLNADELEELDIKLTAHAMNRRGVNTAQLVVPIERLGWPLDVAVDPRY